MSETSPASSPVKDASPKPPANDSTSKDATTKSEHVVWPDPHEKPELRTLRARLQCKGVLLAWHFTWVYGLVFLGFFACYTVYSTVRASLSHNEYEIPDSVAIFAVLILAYITYHSIAVGPEQEPWDAYRAWVRKSLANYPYFRTQISIFEGQEKECLDNPLKPMVKPDQKALFAVHPHGVLCSAFTVNFTHSHRFCEADARWLVADNLFWVPYTSDILRWVQCDSCAKERFVELMKKGKNIGFLPGGFEEATLFQHGKHRVYVNKRFGFIKLALQHGYTVYPAYNFGEEQLFHSFHYFLKFRMMLNRFKLPGVLFVGPNWLIPFMPRPDVDLVTVVGKPIVLPKTENPTKEQVEKYHKIYVDALVDLFERNKKKYAVDPDAKLELY